MGSCTSIAACKKKQQGSKRKNRNKDDITMCNSPSDSHSASKIIQDEQPVRGKQSENSMIPGASPIVVPIKSQKMEASSRKSLTELDSPQMRKNMWKLSFGKDKNPQDNETAGSHENDQSNEAEGAIKVSKTSALEYKRGQLIGKGTLGEVYQCLNLNTGELMALKTIRFPGPIEKARAYCRMVQRELSLINVIPHVNIIRYYYVDIVTSSPEESFVDVVFEYGSGGSIRSILDRFKNLEEKISAIYISQILDALAVLHECDIVHGDIKGSNILIDATGLVKVSDFGCCKWFDPPQELPDPQINAMKDVVFSSEGSVFWAAPEVLQKSAQDKPSDIWSVGCLLIEMLTGLPPWSHKTIVPSEVESLVLSRDAPPFPKGISENCRDFLSIIFQKDPQQRPTAEQLLEHSFIKESQTDDISLSRQDSIASHSFIETKSKLFETQTGNTARNDFPRIFVKSSGSGSRTHTNSGPDSVTSLASPNKFPIASPRNFFNYPGNSPGTGNMRRGRGRGYGTYVKTSEQIIEQQGMEDEGPGPLRKLGKQRQGSVFLKPRPDEDTAPMQRQKGRQSSFYQYAQQRRGFTPEKDPVAQNKTTQNLNSGNRYMISQGRAGTAHSFQNSSRNFIGQGIGGNAAKFNGGETTELHPQEHTASLAEDKAEAERRRIEERKRLEEEMMRDMEAMGTETVGSDASEFKIPSSRRQSSNFRTQEKSPKPLTEEERILQRKKLEEQMMREMEAMGTDTVRSDASELKITIYSRRASCLQSQEKTPKALTEEERILQRKKLEERMLRDCQSASGTGSMNTTSFRGDNSLETMELRLTPNPKQSSNPNHLRVPEGLTERENWKKRSKEISEEMNQPSSERATQKEETIQKRPSFLNSQLSFSEGQSLADEQNLANEQQSSRRERSIAEEEPLKNPEVLTNKDNALSEVEEDEDSALQRKQPQSLCIDSGLLSRDEQVTKREQSLPEKVQTSRSDRRLSSRNQDSLLKGQSDTKLEETKSGYMDQSSACFGQEKGDPSSHQENGTPDKREHRNINEMNGGARLLKHQFSFN